MKKRRTLKSGVQNHVVNQSAFLKGKDI